jgi:hypothetical protein
LSKLQESLRGTNEINTLIASKMKIYTPFSQRIIILLKSKVKNRSYGVFWRGEGIKFVQTSWGSPCTSSVNFRYPHYLNLRYVKIDVQSYWVEVHVLVSLPTYQMKIVYPSCPCCLNKSERRSFDWARGAVGLCAWALSCDL